MTAFAVIPGQGLIFEVYDGVSAYDTVAGITQVDLGDGQTSFTDVSDFSTTGHKAEVPGIRSVGNSTIGFNHYPGDTGQERMRDLWDSGETVAMRVTFTTGEVCDFDAYVDNWGLNGAGVNDNKITGTFTLSMDGDEAWT